MVSLTVLCLLCFASGALGCTIGHVAGERDGRKAEREERAIDNGEVW